MNTVASPQPFCLCDQGNSCRRIRTCRCFIHCKLAYNNNKKANENLYLLNAMIEENIDMILMRIRSIGCLNWELSTEGIVSYLLTFKVPFQAIHYITLINFYLVQAGILDHHSTHYLMV